MVLNYGGKYMRRKIRVFLMIFCFALGISGCREKETADMQLVETEVENPDSDKEKGKNIFVYVCGAVCNEGVYELEPDSRVYEAIEKAGGFTEKAAVTQINQAELLKDETQLYVPTVDEVENQKQETERDSSAAGKVNLNTASKEELMSLSGIGETKAESILRYREQHGRFQSIEEIQEIEGIKNGVFQKIKDKITI